MKATHYEEEDFLALSGLQHFAFCPRQWALIHLEAQWVENQRTAEGRVLHAKAHDGSAPEKRGELLILRDLRVSSTKLGVSGACDVVEFYAHPEGIPQRGASQRRARPARSARFASPCSARGSLCQSMWRHKSRRRGSHEKATQHALCHHRKRLPSLRWRKCGSSEGRVYAGSLSSTRLAVHSLLHL